MKTNQRVTELTQTSLLIAIIALLALVPFLGYIPVGPIRATTIHIPVIIGAILLGPKKGALLGFCFGLTSFLTNTFSPTPLSFVFSPFVPVPGSDSGSFLSLLIAFLPRILIGVVAGAVFGLLCRHHKSQTLGCVLAGFLGSMTNTILVMGGIYFFFGPSYAAAKNMTFEALLGFIGGVIALNGVIEALVASVLGAAVARPLLKYLKK
ncbi:MULTISPECIES: ECF transporter S component [Oscillospiraceae]|uniref:ECF transporter S component n=1 Tax=Oscillospiraceae TaxID=216572 RepID=UPI0009A70572|nr:MULTISPECIES: ECF transporter S component [Oscillospiraceae]RGB69669.1 ECF transporter S component [Harryflintia acetispora]